MHRWLLTAVAILALQAGRPALAEPADIAFTGALPPVTDAENAILAQLRTEGTSLRAALDAYRGRDLAVGDRLAARFSDPVERAVLEAMAIRFNPVPSERIRAFLAAEPDWPGRALLGRRLEERLLAERATPAEVRAFFGAREPETGAGRIALALALAGTERERAVRLARAAWLGDAMGDALEERLLAAFGDAFDRRDHHLRSEMLIFRGSTASGLKSAARAGDDYGLLAKARIAAARGRGKAVDKALGAVPSSLRAEPAYRFARAQVLKRKGEHEAAAKELIAARADAATGDAWWQERRFLARELLDEGKPALAYALIKAHTAQSPAHLVEAEFFAGWVALQFLNRPGDAALHFARADLAATTPISTARVDYWLGRAAEADDRMPDAIAAYAKAADAGITYYGQLARGRLGLPETAIRAARRLDGPQMTAFAASRPVQALHRLKAAGAEDTLAMLYRDFAQSLDTEESLSALAAIAHQQRDATAALAIGKIATQRGFALDEEAFPTFGVPNVATAGAVDPAMVFAIARQESAFAVDARSHAGARGLMQLMPATAQATARQIGVKFELERLTSDGAYNARIGAAHLADLMRDWRGNYILTFASYNAGPGNVRKWVQTYGDPRDGRTDPIDWVERIPFGETRNYVQRVIENLKVYRHRLEGHRVVLSEADLQFGARSR